MKAGAVMDDKRKKEIVDRIKIFLPVVIVTLIVLILTDLFPVFANVFDNYIYPIFMIIMLLLTGYVLVFCYNKKVLSKKRLTKVAPDDLRLIKEFSSIKIGDVPSELIDYIEMVSFLCMDFLEMKKKIFSRDFFDEEFLLEETEGVQEFMYLYNRAKNVVETVYKYYNADGKRII